MSFKHNRRCQNLIFHIDLFQIILLVSRKQEKSSVHVQSIDFPSHIMYVAFLPVNTNTHTNLTHTASIYGSHAKIAANRKRGSGGALVTAGVLNTAASPATTPRKWDWSVSVRSFSLTLGLMVLQPNKWGICLRHKRTGMRGGWEGGVDVTRQTDVPLYYPASSSSLPCVLETKRKIDDFSLGVLMLITEMC